MEAEQQELMRMRALAHPLRLQMLSLLTGAQLSAADVARELGISQANASYHLRHLLAAGLTVSAGEVPVRGGRARLYRYDVDAAAASTVTGAVVATRDRTGWVRAMTHELARRHRLVDPAVRGAMTDAELWVDPASWEQVRTAVAVAAVTLHAAARPPRTRGTIRVSATAVLFGMRDPRDPDQ